MGLTLDRSMLLLCHLYAVHSQLCNVLEKGVCLSEFKVSKRKEIASSHWSLVRASVLVPLSQNLAQSAPAGVLCLAVIALA